MKLIFSIIVLTLLGSFTYLFQIDPNKNKEIEITYIANEGVLIKAKSTQILVDAVFDKEFDYLDVLPNSELVKIEKANAEYASIDVIFATHLHGDHFNALLVGNHLSNNNNALFYGPNETVKSFEDNFADFKSITSRIKSITPNFQESQTITIKNTIIKVLRLEHMGNSPWKEAENVAYLITIDGKKIIHFGDSKIDVNNLERFDLKNENIDVAILPYWQLGWPEQKNIIETYINPKQILVAHIPVGDHKKSQEMIENFGYKNAIPLINKFKTITIK